MTGYAAGTRPGAHLYNLTHATPLPAVMLGAGYWQANRLVMALSVFCGAPSHQLMITLCARHKGERTTAALALQASPARMPRRREPPREEFFGTYLARLPDLRGSPALGSGGPERGVLASWLVTGVSCCWRQGGFCVRAGCTGGVRHRSPNVAGPTSLSGLDLRVLVAGPGFEPGKTVVGDFTDRGRYCPDLREHPPETRFRHALT